MRTFIATLLISILSPLFGQDPTPDTAKYDRVTDFNITGFPIVFNLPETSFGFGGLGLMIFNTGMKKAWRKSQIQVGVAYTLKKQFLLFLPFELYFKQQWKLNGELGYYRYFYNYFGVGIDAKEDALETYDANYPRLFSTLSYRLTDAFLLGIQYHFDYFDIPETDSLLQTQDPVGIEGGVISTIGLVATIDTRDDIFYPVEGLFINFTSEFSGKYSGGRYSYSLYRLDMSFYKTIAPGHILVTNYITGTSRGNLPFFNYYYFSSSKLGRGFNDRRFIDRNISILQLEYRFPIVWRFRGAAFSSLGSVGRKYGENFTNRQLWSYGLGLRFQINQKQLNNLRIDIAGSNEGPQFYVTIGEAF